MTAFWSTHFGWRDERRSKPAQAPFSILFQSGEPVAGGVAAPAPPSCWRWGGAVSTHQWHSWGNNLPAHPALYLEPSLGMETYISGLSATQTNARTHTLTHMWDKKNWFGSSAESKQQTLNVPFPIDEFLCQTSLLFKSSDTGCSSEECIFLLVLMSKMCPFSKGLFCKEGNNEASFYEKDRMFWKFESNIIQSGTVDFPKHVAVLEKSAKAHCKVDGKRTYKAKSSVLFNPQMQTQRQQSSCISCFATGTAETQEKQGFAQGDVAQVETSVQTPWGK